MANGSSPFAAALISVALLVLFLVVIFVVSLFTQDRVMGFVVHKLTYLIDFTSKESRWEFTAILFGLGLFFWSLPAGVQVMWLQYVFWSLGLATYVFLAALVLHFRRHPVDDGTKRLEDKIDRLACAVDTLAQRLTGDAVPATGIGQVNGEIRSALKRIKEASNDRTE